MLCTFLQHQSVSQLLNGNCIFLPLEWLIWSYVLTVVCSPLWFWQHCTVFFKCCLPSVGNAACEPDKYIFIDICLNYPENIVVIFRPMGRGGLLWAIALYLMVLFPVRTNPRWRPPPSWKNFKRPYLRNRSSDPLHVWFYSVIHKIGTPLYFCNNFFKCWSIWMKITSLYSLRNLLSGDVVCNCIFYKYSLYDVK